MPERLHNAFMEPCEAVKFFHNFHHTFQRCPRTVCRILAVCRDTEAARPPTIVRPGPQFTFSGELQTETAPGCKWLEQFVDPSTRWVSPTVTHHVYTAYLNALPQLVSLRLSCRLWIAARLPNPRVVNCTHFHLRLRKWSAPFRSSLRMFLACV